jgi:hypothetical protein
MSSFRTSKAEPGADPESRHISRCKRGKFQTSRSARHTRADIWIPDRRAAVAALVWNDVREKKRSRLLLRLCTQFAANDFSGSGQWQRINEGNLARVFVCCQACLDESGNFLCEFV